MFKGKAVRKNIELAFDVYCQTGGDKSATLRELEKKHGLKISRPTLYAWIEEHRFNERMVEVDARRQADHEAIFTARARMVRGLLDRMDQYERYMSSLEGKPDHMAQFAYNGLVGQLRLLIRKFDYEEIDESLPDEEVKAIAKGITDNVARDIRNKILGVAE